MKKIFGILMIVLTVLTIGCRQKKEEKSTITYAPPPTQMLFEIDQLRQAAERSPKNAEAWTRLGDALMDSQRFAEAVDAYEKSLALEPRNVNVLVDQGTCYRGIGKYDKAVEQYRKAIKINPKFPNAHRNLAIVLGYDLGKAKEGAKELETYLALEPNAPDAADLRQMIKELSANK